jgi:hypothetical protein
VHILVLQTKCLSRAQTNSVQITLSLGFLFDWLCKNSVAISDTFLIESLFIIMSQLLFINKYFQFFARSNLSATFQARVTIS